MIRKEFNAISVEHEYQLKEIIRVQIRSNKTAKALTNPTQIRRKAQRMWQFYNKFLLIFEEMLWK